MRRISNEPPKKLAIYVPREVYKRMQKHRLDLDIDYSAWVTRAIEEKCDRDDDRPHLDSDVCNACGSPWQKHRGYQCPNGGRWKS